MRKQVTYILELHDIEEQGTEFCFRKLKFSYFGEGDQEFGKTCLYNA